MYLTDVAINSRGNGTLKSSEGRNLALDKNGFSATSRLNSAISPSPVISQPAAVLDLSETAQSILARMNPGTSSEAPKGEMSQEAKDALKEFHQSTAANDTAAAEAEEDRTSLDGAQGFKLDPDSNPSDGLNSTEDAKKAKSPEDNTRPKGASGQPLTDKEMAVVAQMKDRDMKVRTHEQAHVSAGGGLTSAPSYEYQTGPDGKRYIVGGHVTIDTSAESTPEATLIKAERIRSAALAPADPSPADRAVASGAMQMAMQARSIIAANNQAESAAAMQKIQQGNEESAETKIEGPAGADSAFNAAETALQGNQTAEDTQQAVQDRQSGLSRINDIGTRPLDGIGDTSKSFGIQKFRGTKGLFPGAGIDAIKPTGPRLVGSGGAVLKSPSRAHPGAQTYSANSVNAEINGITKFVV